MSPRRRPAVRFLSVLVGCALAAAGALLPAGSARAAAGCAFDLGTRTLTVSLDGTPATLSRGAGTAGALQLDGVDCPGATVDSTDTVLVDGTTGGDDLTLDLSQGVLEPGATPELGVSAIETLVDLGDGADTVHLLLTPGADTLDGSADGFDLVSTDHQDLVLANTERLAVDAGAGDDRVTLSDGTPWPGQATIQGGPGADDLTGGDGDDVFVATPAGESSDAEADSYTGSGGTDTVDYTARTAGVTVDLGTTGDSGEGGELDTVAADVERVLTGSGNDIVFGTAGPETIRTGDGDDLVIPLGGDDDVDLGVGVDAVQSGDEGDGADTYLGDELDTLDYTGRTASLVLDLRTGDHLGASGEGDTATGFGTVRGGSGNDLLIGTSASETLLGGPGNDVLVGGGGSDLLFGEEGDDRFGQGTAPDGSDELHGGPGVDTADYSLRSTPVVATLGGTGGAPGETDVIDVDVENLAGGAAADRLTGSALANRLDGNGGADVLRGAGGADLEVGGAGDDWFVADAAPNGADVLAGGLGVDTVDYSRRGTGLAVDLDNRADDGAPGERDNVRSDVENVRGGARADRLVGSAAANRLEGNGGGDLLDGLGGADRLLCGSGADRAVKRRGATYSGCELIR